MEEPVLTANRPPVAINLSNGSGFQEKKFGGLRIKTEDAPSCPVYTYPVISMLIYEMK